MDLQPLQVGRDADPGMKVDVRALLVSSGSWKWFERRDDKLSAEDEQHIFEELDEMCVNEILSMLEFLEEQEDCFKHPDEIFG